MHIGEGLRKGGKDERRYQERGQEGKKERTTEGWEKDREREKKGRKKVLPADKLVNI